MKLTIEIDNPAEIAQFLMELAGPDTMTNPTDEEIFTQFVEEHPEVLPTPPEQEADQDEQEAVQDEQEPAPNPPVHLITYAQVRSESVKLVKKDRSQMQDILADFNVKKLSEIPEGDYPAVYERLVSANAG
jgi:hypothetical protein